MSVTETLDKETYRLMWLAWEARIKVKTRAHSIEEQKMFENMLGLDLTLEEIVISLEKNIAPLQIGFDELSTTRRREEIRRRFE